MWVIGYLLKTHTHTHTHTQSTSHAAVRNVRPPWEQDSSDGGGGGLGDQSPAHLHVFIVKCKYKKVQRVRDGRL